MEIEQQALLTLLEQIVAEYPSMIDAKTLGYWLDEGCVKPKIIRSITTGYAAALLGSKDLMASLCKQYFIKYDANGNGLLELDEVFDLSLALHESLELPEDARHRTQLQESIAAFGETGSLRADEFPLWFAKTLRDCLDKSKEVAIAKSELDKPMSLGYAKALLSFEQLP